jgi:hypothetical protein
MWGRVEAIIHSRFILSQFVERAAHCWPRLPQLPSSRAPCCKRRWVEGQSRFTFPTAYRGVWCNVGNDLFVKAKSETSCPGRSGDFIYNITATGYTLEEDNCKVTQVTADKPNDPNTRSIDVKLYCNEGSNPESAVKSGQMRLERNGKLRIKWNINLGEDHEDDPDYRVYSGEHDRSRGATEHILRQLRLGDRTGCNERQHHHFLR